MNDEKPFAAENPFKKLDKKQFLTTQEKRERQEAAKTAPKTQKNEEEAVVRSFYAEFGSSFGDSDTRAFLNAVSGVSRLGEKAGAGKKKGRQNRASLENPVLSSSVPVKTEKRTAKPSAQEPLQPVAPREQDDAGEFAAAMRDVAPLAGRGREVPPETPPAPISAPGEVNPMRDFMEGKLEFALAFTNEYVEGHVVGLDLMTVGKLQAGQFSPEAHLDLHGMTAQQAFEALVGFFRASYFKGYRTVLVVPGRGLNSPHGFSILREKVQDWFTQEPFRRVILAFCTARPSDGGAGALYVLLRKFRKGQGKVYWDRRPADPDLI